MRTILSLYRTYRSIRMRRLDALAAALRGWRKIRARAWA